MRKLFSGIAILSIILLFSGCDDNSSPPSNNCGDGVVDIGEDCDGIDLNGKGCADYGFYEGVVSCNADCTINTNECTNGGSCGDGVLQSDKGEQCDGDELDNKSCETEGFYEGTLVCASNCKLDFSQCSNYCGDGIITNEEVCDGTNIPGENTTCESLGYVGGELACSDDCLSLDETACYYCGDGNVDSGEVCDGDNLNGKTCSDVSPTFYNNEGDLSCDNSCYFDTSQCHFCGDGVINGGEVCDGTNLGTEATCGQYGYVESDPDCIDNCFTINYDTCEKWEQIDAGYRHTCGIDTIGRVWCWGDGANGKLGNGTLSSSYFPSLVPLALPAISISAGYAHTCAVLNGGEAWCWGSNDYGQLGNNSTVSSSIPVQVVTNTNDFKEISAGYYNSCVVTNGGAIKCWGLNSYGNVGNCTSGENVLTPTSVLKYCMPNHFPLFEMTHVTVGRYHACGIYRIGVVSEVYCWGRNNHGQLGADITDTFKNYARKVVTSTGFDLTSTKLSAGRDYTCSKSYNSNNVLCWGEGLSSQLGNGVPGDSFVADYVVTDPNNSASHLANISDFSSSFSHVCAKNSSGEAYCWGRNDEYQLGTGDTNHYNYAVLSTYITQLGTPSNITTGNEYTCWFTPDGFINCVGSNVGGQFGNGNTNDAVYVPGKTVFQ